MSQLTTEDRLAALQARRRPRNKPEQVAACAKAVAVDAIQPTAPPRWLEPAPAPTSVRFDETAVIPVVRTSPVLQQQAPFDLIESGVLESDSSATVSQTPESPVVWPAVVAEVPVSRMAGKFPRALAGPREIPWERVTAAGASLVSFAAMIVAMGPLFKVAESSDIATTSADPSAPAGDAVAGATAATPVAPAVDIQVTAPVDEAEAQVPVDESITTASPDSTATAEAAQTATESGGTQTTTQPEAAPTTAAPAAADGSTEATTAPTTAPPTTAASQETVATPETAPPTTAAPTTAAPTTAPPTTAPPATAPSDTPPPRSDGSG